MQTKAGIERAVVDVLRKLGFLEGAPKGRPPLRIVETEDDGGHLHEDGWLLGYWAINPIHRTAPANGS
jgi:hypothetical protein